MKKKSISRRRFLKNSSAAATTAALYFGTPWQALANKAKKTRVVLVRDESVLDDLNKPKPEVLENMLHRALTTLLDVEEPSAAWKQLIRPEDTVGIKSNVWRYLRTPESLEQNIKDGLLQAGVPEERISISDRGVRRDPVFQNSTALINVRPIRTHYWSGVGSLIKNYIMFVDRPPSWHGDTCADLAGIWDMPEIKGKTRLNILVMLTPLFHGQGPHHFQPKYTWPYKGLILGTDPVAADATGVRILLAKRKEYFGKDSPLNPPPKHVFLADTRHHLGTADPEKIELIKLGSREGVLI